MSNLIDYNVPGAFEAITVADTPIGLTAAKIAVGRDSQAMLSVETNSIRFTFGDTAPSATDGYLMAVGDAIVLTGKEVLNALRMHQSSGAAAVKVIYFHAL